MIAKLVSGGQTGADRAGLDTALALGIPIGGWVPKGRAAEDGPLPDHYTGMRETDQSDPAIRTRRNVRDSDATVVLSHGPLRGGSLLTIQEAHAIGRPALHLDLLALEEAAACHRLVQWLAHYRPEVLNVAGPRASEDPRIYRVSLRVLSASLPAAPSQDDCAGTT